MSSSKPTLLTLLASDSLSSPILSSPALQSADLASLVLVSKDFRLATTPFLYSRVIIYSPNAARRFLNTVIQKPVHGPFVNTLFFSAHRNQPRIHYNVSRELTLGLAKAFPLLRNLEFLSLHDSWEFSAGIFTYHPHIYCKLQVCRLNGITFSSQGRIDEMFLFFAQQNKLEQLRLQVNALPEDHYDAQFLHGSDAVVEDRDVTLLPPYSLPSLIHFDGAVFAATKLIQSRAPLVYVRLHTAMESDLGFSREEVGPPPEVFASVLEIRSFCSVLAQSGVGKTMKGFSVLGCPGDEELHELTYSKGSLFKDVGDVGGDLLQVLALKCPHLLHAGVIPLSFKNRSPIHAALMEMHHLRSIEFSVAPWVTLGPGAGVLTLPSMGLQHSSFPSPTVLKTISMELKVYCPTIKFFIYTFRFPQPTPGYNRVERVIWACARPLPNHSGWEEWVPGDMRYNWDELWSVGYNSE